VTGVQTCALPIYVWIKKLIDVIADYCRAMEIEHTT